MKIGILGDGQLGRMLVLSAYNQGHQIWALSNVSNSPIAQVTPNIIPLEYTLHTVEQLAQNVDAITCEFENIPINILHNIQHMCFPSLDILKIAQNKFFEKRYVKSLRIPTTQYQLIRSYSELESALRNIQSHAILKTTTLGYDGKGQIHINMNDDISMLQDIQFDCDYILEHKIDFLEEISVLISRDIHSNIEIFPISRNIHKNGILRSAMPYSNIDISIQHQALSYTQCIAEDLDLVGILAVEFFVTKDHKVIFNEMAPRPHNSFHWTMNGCSVSQFDQLIRILTQEPLIHPYIYQKYEMQNILGQDFERMKNNAQGVVYRYGKLENTYNRKIGHINVPILE